MTEIERHIENVIERRKAYIQSIRDEMAEGSMMPWKKAVKVRVGDEITLKGMRHEVVFIKERQMFGFMELHVYAKQIGNDADNEERMSRLSVQLPENDEWIEDIRSNKQSVIDFMHANEQFIDDFFNAHRDDEFYECGRFLSNSFDKTDRDFTDDRKICELCLDFVRMAAKLYKYVPENGGAFIRFMDSETTHRLKNGFLSESKFDGSCIKGAWWKYHGWLDFIEFTRRDARDKYDNWNVNAPIEGLTVMTCSFGELKKFCFYGSDGGTVNLIANPMQMAHICIILFEKIRKDFEIQ